MSIDLSLTIMKKVKTQPKTFNSTPHPFKKNLFSFWGYAGEMGI
jgi:hypothetical protein